MRRKPMGLYDRIFRGSRHPSQQAMRAWRRRCRWQPWFSSSLLRYKELSAESVAREARPGLGSAGPAAKRSRQYPRSAWVFRILSGGTGRPVRSLGVFWRGLLVPPRQMTIVFSSESSLFHGRVRRDRGWSRRLWPRLGGLVDTQRRAY